MLVDPIVGASPPPGLARCTRGGSVRSRSGARLLR